MKYFHRYKIEHLLSLTGFKINKLYSDFNKNEFCSIYPSRLIIKVKKNIELLTKIQNNNKILIKWLQ
jgi:hypothetical protein